MEPIAQYVFQAEELIRSHPPHFRHRNKMAVYEIAASGAPFAGTMHFARWVEEPLPLEFDVPRRFSIHTGIYEYATSSEASLVAWHANFADPFLFVAYDSVLMAQDELQVAEHPILGSIRDALESLNKTPITVDERGRPTPITITGVQRRCAIDTLPNPTAGRPAGLYGNVFARAPIEQVKAATKLLFPPTITNILAISAPPGGYGAYTKDEIDYIVNTAFTGFSAARQESERIAGNDIQTVIHTGFWGCGAFGGNRTLMTTLQALAGDLAGVDIVFWSVDQAGVLAARDAHDQYKRLRATTSSVQTILEHLFLQKFQWGISDGN